jgi:oligosaccharide repeat unit polymerase
MNKIKLRQESNGLIIIVIFFTFVAQTFVAMLNPYNFHALPSSVKLLNAANSFLLLLGFFLIYSFKPVIRLPTKMEETLEFTVLGNLAYWLVIIFCFSVAFLYLRLKFQLGLSFQDLRDVVFSIDSLVMRFMPVIWAIKGFAVYYFIVLIYALCLARQAFSMKIKFWLLLAAYLTMALSSGSRAFVFELLILAIITISFFKFRIGKKFARSTLLLITFVLIIFIPIFIDRLADRSIFEFLTEYMVGPVFFFGDIVENNAHLDDRYRFGFSFMSVDWLVTGILRYLGMIEQDSLITISNYLIHTGSSISDQKTFNAYPTALFYFYVDFGFFAPLVYVVLLVSIYLYSLSKRNTMLSFLYYALFIFLLIDGTRGNLLNAPWFLLILFLIFQNKLFVKIHKNRLYLSQQLFTIKHGRFNVVGLKNYKNLMDG